jgi:hypothetical protein
MKYTAEEKAYQRAYREFHREKINKRARDRARVLMGFLVIKCVVCGAVLPIKLHSRRGRYCKDCAKEAYRKMHNRAAYNYYLRNK